MLSSLSDDKTEYIKFVRNTYRWNNDIPCTVDVEEFERYWSEASDKEKSIDERISLYEKALSIYGGEFLPKSSYVNWVIAKSSYYTSIYNECVLRVCSLLADTKRFEEMVGVCEKAVVIAPFEEQIHKWLIYAYINCKKSSKAMAHYEYVLDLFQRELNVDLSDSLRNLHREIVNGVNAVETDLSVIKQDLQEVCETNGAFYCDYEVFKNIYRVLARSMLRTGQSIHVGLITLTDANGDMPDERDIKKAKEQLRDCVVFSLRKGDAVASYSASQFIITLPLTTFENGQMVLERIVKPLSFGE